MALHSDREKFAHVLRRFGLGASEAELDYYLESGYEQGIERLLNFERVPEALEPDITFFTNEDRFLPMPGVKLYVYQYLLTTTRPLEAKLTLFWHDHFATSSVKVEIPKAMYVHWEMLRSNCAGKFSDLLEAVTKDPAMLYWLDNHENVAGSPNENFARELFELFTTGIGPYTEEDVKETARAFTGYTFQRIPDPDSPVAGPRYDFIFRPRLHDFGQKKVLGHTGTLNGDDVLKIAVEHEATSKFVARKFWEYFVYESPSDAVIDRVAAAWRARDLDIKELVKIVLNHPEFFGDRAVRKQVKNPADFVISVGRQSGAGAVISQRIQESGEIGARQARAAVQVYAVSCRSMGMDILSPPDVDGWPVGEAWISSATMLERIKLADNVFTLGQNRIQIVPLDGLFQADMSAREVCDKLISIFDAQIPDSKVRSIAASIDGEMRPGRTLREYSDIIAKATSVLFGTPEFQLH